MYIRKERGEAEQEMRAFMYFQKYWRIASLDLKFWVFYGLLQKSQTYFKVTVKSSGSEGILRSWDDLNTILNRIILTENC